MRSKVITGAVLAFAPALLFAADAQVEAARQCAQQKDSLQRLVCYDHIFQAGEPAPVAHAATPAAVAAAPAATAAAASAPVAAAPAAAAPAVVAGAAVVAAAPAAVPAAAAASAPALGDEALKKPAKDKASEPKSLEARVTAMRETHPEQFRVTLDNGQIWQQQDVSSLFHVGVGDVVRIEKGSMGSYRMALAKGSGWVRVTRVQ